VQHRNWQTLPSCFQLFMQLPVHGAPAATPQREELGRSTKAL